MPHSDSAKITEKDNHQTFSLEMHDPDKNVL